MLHWPQPQLRLPPPPPPLQPMPLWQQGQEGKKGWWQQRQGAKTLQTHMHFGYMYVFFILFLNSTNDLLTGATHMRTTMLGGHRHYHHHLHSPSLPLPLPLPMAHEKAQTAKHCLGPRYIFFYYYGHGFPLFRVFFIIAMVEKGPKVFFLTTFFIRFDDDNVEVPRPANHEGKSPQQAIPRQKTPPTPNDTPVTPPHIERHTEQWMANTAIQWTKNVMRTSGEDK